MSLKNNKSPGPDPEAICKFELLVHADLVAQVNCKICLKSAGLYEFFGWF